jgi:hypothetical protein
MTLIEILDALRFTPKDRNYPEEVIQAAIAEKEEITPILLKELEDIFDDPDLMKDDEDYMLPFYAMFILAKLREPKAFSRIINLFSLPPEVVDVFFGDISTESLQNLLASTFDGDVKPLLNFIKNEACFEWARGGAARALVTLYANELIERDVVQSHFLDLLNTVPYNEKNVAYDSIMRAAIEIKPDGELNKKISDSLNEHMFDPWIGLEGLYEKMSPKSVEEAFDELKKGQNHDLIDNVKDCLGYWQCFQADIPHHNESLSSAQVHEKKAPMAHDRKVGRNEPCPCGSGKKHKKCCG